MVLCTSSTYDGWTVEGTFPGINGYTVEYPGLDDDIPWEEKTLERPSMCNEHIRK